MNKTTTLVKLKFVFCALFAAVIIVSGSVNAQTSTDAILYSNGGQIYTSAGSLIHVNGGFTNDAGTLDHNGDLKVNNSGTEGSIYLLNGSTTQGDGLYLVEQNWLNSATFIGNNSDVELFGNTAEQLITGTNPTTFNNLILTSATGTRARLTLNATVAGQLVLNDRELATNDNLLSVTNPSVNAITNSGVTGAEGFVSSNYVVTGLGALLRATNASQAYLFPTGSSAGTYRYRPIEIRPASANGNTYSVRMANVDASAESFDRTAIGLELCSNNPDFFHRINRTSGSDPADVTIFYKALADGNWSNAAQWNIPNNLEWNALGVVSAGTSGNFETITKNAVNSFGVSTTPFILSQTRPAAPSLTGDQLICSNTQMSYIASGNASSTYNWTVTGGVIVSDSTQQTITIEWGSVSPGSISVTETIQGTATCASIGSTSYNVTIDPKPIAGFDTTFSGPLSQYVAFTDTSLNGVNWYWDFGDGATSTVQNPNHNYPNSGTYIAQLIVESANSCKDTISVEITMSEGIIIPNVFSPNGDGKNDWFYIPNTGLGEFSIEIYNRWGTKIWETTAPEIRWDGRTSAGLPVSDGTYFYILKAVGKEKDHSINGTVNLFR
ncbi:MAG: gliding motility-associated C-terminal domain-containing protein [Bacteroidota bacterium]|nr:gliding motility-associated C-terminal domain-containing protein [Bacteroidota bacterium]